MGLNKIEVCIVSISMIHFKNNWKEMESFLLGYQKIQKRYRFILGNNIFIHGNCTRKVFSRLWVLFLEALF